MKLYSLFLCFISIFYSFPIQHVTTNLINDEIEIYVNEDGDYSFLFSYYKNGVYMDYKDDTNIYSLKKGECATINIDKQYSSVIIEIYSSTGDINEVEINIPQKKESTDIEVSVQDESIFEAVEIKYVINELGKISETIEIGNKLNFKQQNNYLLPKIIEIDKLTMNYDSKKDKELKNCYLMLNDGLKDSDFNKNKEDFYIVPLKISIIDNHIKFSLDGEYFYDFNKGVMKNKKSNNSVRVNDIILSKDDKLLTEAYLVIEQFGYSQNKFQLDLLLEEKPLFGKNGYYKIEKLS